MGIKKKIFLLLFSVSTIILCFSYVFNYNLFHKALMENLIRHQQTEISLNASIINHFADFARQNIMMLVGDPYLGQSLSADPESPLERLQNRELIETSVSHYANAQTPGSYPCRSTLFLNHESVPLSLSFESITLSNIPYHLVSNVFSDQLVASQEWYRNTLDSPRNFYAFINEDTRDFCIAQKFQNAYFTGPYHPAGQGILVLSVDMDQMEEAFDFSPVTPNSKYALFNHTGGLLYSNADSLPSSLLSGLTAPFGDSQNVITLDGEKYLLNTSAVNYQMSLVFLTPYSDISHTISSVMNIYILFSLGILVFLMISFYILSCRITRPIIYMSDVIGAIEDTRNYNPRVFDSIRDKELLILCQSFNQLVEKINDLFVEMKLQDEKEMKAELKTLQAQINPHFIFNAMDVVNWIALSRNDDDIAAIVNSIANLMRYSITDADHMVDIHLEVQNIHEFISIYQLRHNSRISLDLDGLPAQGTLMIPKFTIQPLVENSIRHGIIDEETPIIIRLNAYENGRETVIEVSDNGKGGDPAALNAFLAYEDSSLKVSSGFGIRNVDQRIRLNFKGASGLSYFSGPDGGLTARILLEGGQTTAVAEN